MIGATKAWPRAVVGFGLFSGFFMGNIFPVAFEIVPAEPRASAVGLLNFFGAAVSGFALLFGGMWKHTVGIERLLTYTAIAYLLGSLLLIAGITWLFRRDYERIHQPVWTRPRKVALALVIPLTPPLRPVPPRFPASALPPLTRRRPWL